MTLEPLHVVPDGTYVRVRKNDDGTWHGNGVRWKPGHDISAGDVQAGLTLSHAGSSVFTFGRMAGSEAAVFESGAKGSVELEITIDKPLIWDIDEPNLYECSVSLKYKGEVQHEESQKIGFCTKEYSPENGFILNGRKVRLNGVCEHHDNGCLGAAFNVNAFRRKLNKLRKMGVNAVRTYNMPAKEVLSYRMRWAFIDQKRLICGSFLRRNLTMQGFLSTGRTRMWQAGFDGTETTSP